MRRRYRCARTGTLALALFGGALLAGPAVAAQPDVDGPVVGSVQVPTAPAGEPRGTTPQRGSGTITGSVLDPEDEPVEGALVRLFGPNRLQVGQTDSGADGRFRFDELGAANYELRVTLPPFRDRVQLVTVGNEPVEVVVRFSAQFQEEVIVTGNRGLVQDETKVAGTIRSLSLERLEERAPDLLPRMLNEETGVIAQQTTPGQGSPILRGQSAQAVLYLIDGIRYNNSTYRAGNTQYLAWIPGVAVDGLDVQLGPSGVNYGSDALGGAINVTSAQLPAFASTPAWQWNGDVRVFGESASQGLGINATLGAASARFAAMGAVTGGAHQELRGGRGEDSHNVLTRYFGLSRDQVEDVLGNRMVDTDYGRSGFTGKASWRAGETGTLTGFFLRSDQYDVRRYDRLLGGDGRNIAAFTPQRLEFGYARYQDVVADDVFVEATLSLNRQTDGRRDQRFPDSTLRIEQGQVTSVGYEFLGSSSAGSHLFSFGGEVYDEYIDTFRDEVRNGVTTRVRPRVPDGARYTSVGMFVLDDWAALDDRLQVSGGARFSYFRAATDAADNIIGGEAVVPDTRESFTDVTFNVGTTLQLTDEAGIYGRVARGFRAPSLFDIGEQGLTGGGFEVAPREAVDVGAAIGDGASNSALSTGLAWASLDPELLWSLEGGFRWRDDKTRFDFAVFDSELTDTISRRTLIVTQNVVGRTIGGEVIVEQDAAGRIFVALDNRPVVSRVNIGRSRVWGVEWLFERTLAPDWLLTFKGGIQRGTELDTGNFARKIAPDHLNVVLRWNQQGGRWWLEGVLVGMLRQDRFNPADFDDPRIGAFRDAEGIEDFFNNGAQQLGVVVDDVLLITGETLPEIQRRVLGPSLEGNALFSETPGWWTLTLRGGYTFNAAHELSFAFANLLDRNYRLHGSGFDAAGFNATVAWHGRF